MNEPAIPQNLRWYSQTRNSKVVRSFPVRWKVQTSSGYLELQFSIAAIVLIKLDWRPGDRIDLAADDGCVFLRKSAKGRIIKLISRRRAIVGFALSGIHGLPHLDARSMGDALAVWVEEKTNTLIVRLQHSAAQ